MSNLTSKKQTRVLYLTLTVLLTAAVVLSVLTFQAARRETEQLPEADTRLLTQNPEAKQPNTGNEKNSADSEEAGLFDKLKITDEEETEAETEEKKQKTDAEAGHEEAAAAADILPVFYAPITGGTVIRSHSVTVPVYSPTMEDYRTHTGVDIACSAASPVLAAADGKIGSFWQDPLMGYTLSVIHAGDAVTIYQGIAEELPEGICAGAEVKAGQVIACTGNTALIECEDEEHLHFMMHIGGSAVDPMEYIAMSTMASVYED